MASLDVEKLLQEISADEPCGADMEYEPDFQELERSAQYRPEQQIGDAVVEAEEPNWGEVQKTAISLFSKTKDLRVGMYLTRASLHMNGFVGFAQGLSVIRGLLENYWQDVHPQLDPEDNNDPTFRVNTVATLCDADTVLRATKTAPIVSAKGIGQFSIRDIDIAKGLLQPTAGSEETALDMAMIDAAFMECELDELKATAQSVNTGRELVAGIESIFTEQVSASKAPNLSEMTNILRHISTELNEQLQRRGVNDGEEEQPDSDGGQMEGKAAPISGNIRSREDVIRAIDKICDYYKQQEPSSPIPILLQRAKRLVRKDFMEILQDIAPDGMKQAQLIRGEDG